jgi:hypothetical protein
MDGTCSKPDNNQKYVAKFWFGKLGRRHNLEDLDLNGRMWTKSAFGWVLFRCTYVGQENGRSSFMKLGASLTS